MKTRQLKQIYQNDGLLKHLDNITFLHGKWAHNPEAPTCDLVLLDNFIKMQVGNSHINRILDNEYIYDYIRTVFNSSTYKLDALWESTLLEFNPIENYDRYEDTQNNNTVTAGERNSSLTAGERKATNIVGEREQTNSVGARTSTTEDHTTAFDSADYEKATEKSETTNAATSDTIHNDEATDKTTQEGYTDTTKQDGYTDTNNTHITSHIHGNIGVVDAPTMLTKYRELTSFNFSKEVVKLFEEYILELNYEMEEY